MVIIEYGGYYLLHEQTFSSSGITLFILWDKIKIDARNLDKRLFRMVKLY